MNSIYGRVLVEHSFVSYLGHFNIVAIYTVKALLDEIAEVTNTEHLSIGHFGW